MAGVQRQTGADVGAFYLERPGENVLLKVHATAHGAAIDFNHAFADPHPAASSATGGRGLLSP